MSIWSSICITDPEIEILDGGYGQDVDPKGWIDVAHGWGNIRLIVRCEDYIPGEASVAFTPDSARRLIGLLQRAIESAEHRHE